MIYKNNILFYPDLLLYITELFEEDDNIRLCISNKEIGSIVKNYRSPLFFRLNDKLFKNWGTNFITPRPRLPDVDIFLDKRWFKIFEQKIEKYLRPLCPCSSPSLTVGECICIDCVYCNVMLYFKRDTLKLMCGCYCFGINKYKPGICQERIIFSFGSYENIYQTSFRERDREVLDIEVIRRLNIFEDRDISVNNIVSQTLDQSINIQGIIRDDIQSGRQGEIVIPQEFPVYNGENEYSRIDSSYRKSRKKKKYHNSSMYKKHNTHKIDKLNRKANFVSKFKKMYR